jgi:hypothetical protein
MACLEFYKFVLNSYIFEDLARNFLDFCKFMVNFIFLMIESEIFVRYLGPFCFAASLRAGLFWISKIVLF